MKKYKYKAINDYGKYVRGKISAENTAELEVLLKGHGLSLISYGIDKGNLFKGRLKDKEVVEIFSYLGQLDSAGISIIDSIADLENAFDSSRIKDLGQAIDSSLRKGLLLSEALAEHPHIFPPVIVGLIATGEKTGDLQSAFSSIVDHLKWNMNMKKKITKATRYPIISLVIMLGVVGVMTTFVVPKVTEFLTSQSIALPIMTRSLIGFSNFVKNYGILMIILVPVIIVIYKVFRNISHIGIKIDEFKLHIPVLGKVINKIEASQFSHFFALTFKSGLGVLECLEVTKHVIKNLAIKQSIDIAKEEVANGETLAKSIAKTGHFPHMVVTMFNLGETSGNMEKSLNNIRYFYDKEVDESIDVLVGMIQPMLTLVMGGMMAWITIAVFGPIYSSFGKF